MKEPTFDANGYPTEDTIEAIEMWGVDDEAVPTPGMLEALMDFVGRAWSYPNYWEKTRDFVDPEYPGDRPHVRYVFSTGGWSGNESLVSAMENNLMLAIMGPWSWRRGGHYEYRLPQEET